MSPVVEWLDGIEAIILAVGVVITSIGSILGARWAYLSRGYARRANQQVSNSHPTNLRDDVDGLKAVAQAALVAAQSAQEAAQSAQAASEKAQAAAEASATDHGMTLQLIEQVHDSVSLAGHQIGEVRTEIDRAQRRHDQDVAHLTDRVGRLETIRRIFRR